MIKEEAGRSVGIPRQPLLSAATTHPSMVHARTQTQARPTHTQARGWREEDDDGCGALGTHHPNLILCAGHLPAPCVPRRQGTGAFSVMLILQGRPLAARPAGLHRHGRLSLIEHAAAHRPRSCATTLCSSMSRPLLHMNEHYVEHGHLRRSRGPLCARSCHTWDWGLHARCSQHSTEGSLEHCTSRMSTTVTRNRKYSMSRTVTAHKQPISTVYKQCFGPSFNIQWLGTTAKTTYSTMSFRLRYFLPSPSLLERSNQ
jgi:hypothetical protein